MHQNFYRGIGAAKLSFRSAWTECSPEVLGRNALSERLAGMPFRSVWTECSPEMLVRNNFPECADHSGAAIARIEERKKQCRAIAVFVMPAE